MQNKVTDLKNKNIKTSKGVFHIFETFVDKEEISKKGYEYYFTHENIDIYICHFDKKNFYRVHFGAILNK